MGMLLIAQRNTIKIIPDIKSENIIFLLFYFINCTLYLCALQPKI